MTDAELVPVQEKTILLVPDFNQLPVMSKKETRELINKIEEDLKKYGTPIEFPINHHFSNKVYAREMKMPAGSIVVGKIQKKENFNILSEGEVSILSIDGVMTIKAPYAFVASTGAKRVIHAHTDVVWTVIHGTDEKDVDKIEDEFIAKDYEDLYLSSDRSLESVLHALDTSPEELTLISENIDDQTDEKIKGVYISDSPIHGKGLYAEKEFGPLEYICEARFNGKRTIAGRYSNHSGTPNAKMEMDKNGDVYLIAISTIKKDEEILTDYYFNYKNSKEDLCLG